MKRSVKGEEEDAKIGKGKNETAKWIKTRGRKL